MREVICTTAGKADILSAVEEVGISTAPFVSLIETGIKTALQGSCAVNS